MGFSQYWCEKSISYVRSYRILLVAHNFGTDIRLFDRMSYSAHVRARYVVFCTLSSVFGNIGMIGVYRVLCYILLLLLRIVLALIFDYLTKCRILRMYRCKLFFLVRQKSVT